MIIAVTSGNTTVDVSTDTVLLSQLENDQIAPIAHCRDGVCGCCRTKLLSGSVEYVSDKLGCTRGNEILPCICKATSDIEIEV